MENNKTQVSKTNKILNKQTYGISESYNV